MKLKMESSGDVTILTVTESVGADHIAVLKAGLSKLGSSGKDQFIIDITPLSERDIEVTVAQPGLDQLSRWAGDAGFDLVVVSKISRIGDVDDRAKAMEIFQAKFSEILFQEVKLKAELRELTSGKAVLETKLNKLKGEEQKVRALRQEHARTRAAVKALEKQVLRAVEKRIKDKPLDPSENIQKAQKIVPAILAQQGVIKTG